MDNHSLGLIVMAALVLLAVKINDNANKTLDQEKKAGLIDLFAKGRTLKIGILIAIVVVFFISSQYHIIDPHLSLVIYLPILLMYSLGTAYLNYKVLKDNEYPAKYINLYLLSGFFRVMGMATLFLPTLF